MTTGRINQVTSNATTQFSQRCLVKLCSIRPYLPMLCRYLVRVKEWHNTPWEVAMDSQTKRTSCWNSIWLLAGSTRLLSMQRPSFHTDAWSKFEVLGHNCQCYADIWWEWTNGHTFLGKWPRIHKPNAIIIETAYDYWQDQPGYFQCNDPVFTQMLGQTLKY
jgi:hypothetical protein